MVLGADNEDICGTYFPSYLVWGIITECMLSKSVLESHQLLQPGMGEGLVEGEGPCLVMKLQVNPSIFV